jgi:hypothetical protein
MATILLTNANVLTLDNHRPKADWILADHGMIIAVGDKRETPWREVRKTDVIDCRGRTVLPGFIDAHLHLLALADSRVTPWLSKDQGIHSIKDIVQKLRQISDRQHQGSWIRAKGYHEMDLVERRHPTRRDLDDALPHHPVKLTHRSGHVHVLNSLALDRAGIGINTSEPPGGLIDREVESGEPSGVLYGLGELLSQRIPARNPLDLERGMRIANLELLESGITTVHDTSVRNDFEALNRLLDYKHGGLLIPRVNAWLGPACIDRLEAGDIPSSSESHGLCVKGVKIILQETTGRLHPEPSDLKACLQRVHSLRLQAAVHAIEENVISAACDAMDAVCGLEPRPDHRHRIEHCSVCPPALARRIASLGIAIVTQPGFIYHHGDRYLKTVAPEQRAHLYPLRTLLEANIRVAGSSDGPLTAVNPWIGIYAACCRRSKAGDSLKRSERISIKQALALFTSNAAYAGFEEPYKGSIAPGKFADLVVVSEDPLTLPQEELHHVHATMTVIDGRIAWANPG